MKKYRINDYCKVHQISRKTVYNWKDKGLISFQVDNHGKTWIVENDSTNEKEPEEIKELYTVIYVSVEPDEDPKLLEDQEKILTGYCKAKDYKIVNIVKEISTFFETPKKLLNILLDDSIDVIVVDSIDKINIFRSDIIIKLLEKQEKKIDVVNKKEISKKSIESIFQWGCDEFYGKRKAGEVMKDIATILEKYKP